MKEPSPSYFVRNSEAPEFFGHPLTKGERQPVNLSAPNSEPCLFYSHPHGEIWLGDSIEWLRGLDAGS
ncbi:MAG TPA: site-specific DNA-methyltransferase, partial [Phycisphaerae bacterium]|nr:site-specific DNA-methyltransferase [Phycisphaerae bacterium]